MSFEAQDSQPNQTRSEEELTAEAGFSLPETLPPNPESSSDNLSRFQRLKRDGKQLLDIVRNADEADIIRGYTQF